MCYRFCESFFIWILLILLDNNNYKFINLQHFNSSESHSFQLLLYLPQIFYYSIFQIWKIIFIVPIYILFVQLYKIIKLAMSFFGVELNAQLNRLYLEIRLKLSQNKLIPNFRTIYRSFAKIDPNITGVVSLTDFDKSLQQNQIFLKKYQLQVFQKAYKDQTGLINWFGFMGHLREPMGPVRRQLVEKIFDSMDTKKALKLNPEQLMIHFNANVVDTFKKTFKSQQQLQHTVLSLFSTPEGYITKDEFIAFYNDCNINFHHNEVFARYVSSQWNYSYQKLEVAKEQEVKAASKLLRARLVQKSQGTKDQYLLRKLFEQFDLNQNYSLGPYELDLILKKLGVPAAPRIVDPLLQKIDTDKSGFIEFNEFKKYLFTDPYPI